VLFRSGKIRILISVCEVVAFLIYCSCAARWCYHAVNVKLNERNLSSEEVYCTAHLVLLTALVISLMVISTKQNSLWIEYSKESLIAGICVIVAYIVLVSVFTGHHVIMTLYHDKVSQAMPYAFWYYFCLFSA